MDHEEECGRSDVSVTSLAIYVSEHCPVCLYAREVADMIRAQYPSVVVDVIDVVESRGAVPEVVFATPTYVLNGRVWSLGNPSQEMIRAAFG